MIIRLLLILTVTISAHSFSQVSLESGNIVNRESMKPMLLKSTITTVGSATSTLLSGKKYKVLQSIGQSGIIGKSEFNNTEIYVPQNKSAPSNQATYSFFIAIYSKIRPLIYWRVVVT